MNEPPDELSFGSRWGRDSPRPEPRRQRLKWVAGAAAVALVCAGLAGYLGLQVKHQDRTISQLRAALHHRQNSATATAAEPIFPVASGSAMSTFPDAEGGTFSMIAEAIRPHVRSKPLTWLYVYGHHAQPGERYGLLQGFCGGQYVTATDLTDAAADRQGNVTMVAPNLDIDPSDAHTWVLVYRWQDGSPLGGVRGPLIGTGDKIFRGNPPC